MKVSKVFGCVLGLHFGVIALLLIQPGCRTKQPPTRTYTQERTIKSSVQGASRGTEELIPATRLGAADGLDAAFNAGFDDGSAGMANEFSEFDDVAPIEPLSPGVSGGQTVDVTGPSYETYTIKKGDNLWSIAKRYNVSLNELYAANGLDKNAVLRIGQQIQIPVEGGSAPIDAVSADTYQPSSLTQDSTKYTVKRGDTLSKIADRYDTSVRAIKAANGKSSDLIRVGETLIIPVGANASGSSAPASGAADGSTSSVRPATPASTASTAGTRTHTVKAGEYPATIARQYGMTAGELLALNGIADPRKLQVGQVLKVSASGSSANVDSRTERVVAPSAATTNSSAIPATRTSGSFTTDSPSGPVDIKVIPAEPLVEGGERESSEIYEEMFEGAVEIPVIRLEE